MKITKFRALSLIAILSCIAAWSVGLRGRSNRDSVERSRVSERAPNVAASVESQPEQRSVGSVDPDPHSVQQASAAISSTEGVVLLSSDSNESWQASTTGNPSSQESNQDSNQGSSANRNPTSDAPSKPVKRKQVVDLRDRIASNATAIRGTEVHNTSAPVSEQPQQRSSAWVDSAIPRELFERANIAPRGPIAPNANSTPPATQQTPTQQTPTQQAPQEAPQQVTQPAQQQAQQAVRESATQSPVDSNSQAPVAQVAPSTAPSTAPSSRQDRVPGATYTPDQAIPQWINPNSTQQPNASTAPARRSDPSTGAVNLPPPDERIDRPEPKIQSGSPTPSSTPETSVLNRSNATTDATSNSSGSNQADPPVNSTREVPTGLKLSPGQVIPDWIYTQAGEKPPADPRISVPQTSSPGSKPTVGQQASPTDLPPPNRERGTVVPEVIDAPLSLSEPSPSNRPAPDLQQNLQPNQLQNLPQSFPQTPAQIAQPDLIAPSPNGVGNNVPNPTEKSDGAPKTSNVPLFYHPEQQHPQIDPSSCRVGYNSGDFSNQGGPQYHTFDPCAASHVYRGKFAITTQRPLVELWRPLYTGGVYAPAPTWFGVTNPMKPHFMVYGDARTAVGINQNANGKSHIWSNVLNLDMDLQLTSTERIHAFVSPLNRATKASGLSFNDEVEFIDGMNFDFNTLFFEGDAGALLGGANGTYPPFDLPFTFGLIPLVYQNGIWANDAALGAAMALPAKNSSFLKWSNFDASVFWATDNVTTDAFRGQDHAADFFGTAWFIDAYEGYIEADYAFVNDNTGSNRGYHNISMAFTRRYFMRLSNSVRYIVNAGQSDLAKANRTADGQLLLIENSFITAYPNTVVPYFNMFYGQGRPQSLARAGVAGGILTNTGINFETDGMTNYPTLDPTGSNTVGFASGVNLLGSQFRHQLVLEFAMLQALGSRSLRNAAGDEYGFGVRYQKPLSHNLIFRTDHMVGLRDEATNIAGSRFELRWKF